MAVTEVLPDADESGAGEGTPPVSALTGDPLWDDWSEPPRVPSIPVLHLDGFDGPMDLLLDLAERQRIDLGRMSILALAEQFVAAVERLVGKVALERRADWHVLAARLVLLRSRLMFPESPEEAASAERDAAAELRRLEAMAFVRAASSWLQARPQLGQEVFARPEAEAPRESGYVALMEACLVVLRSRAGEPALVEASVYRPPLPSLWRVPDALARIRAVLAERPEGGDLSSFLPPIATDATIAAEAPDRTLQTRAAVASTLVAGLELAREGVLSIQQAEDFETVTMAAAAGSEERETTSE
jgi:segregation and condensation protein A